MLKINKIRLSACEHVCGCKDCQYSKLSNNRIFKIKVRIVVNERAQALPVLKFLSLAALV